MRLIKVTGSTFVHAVVGEDPRSGAVEAVPYHHAPPTTSPFWGNGRWLMPDQVLGPAPNHWPKTLAARAALPRLIARRAAGAR